MAYHAARGDSVRAIFVTDGVGARPDYQGAGKRQAACRKANRIVGAGEPVFLDFPDNQLDTVPLLSVTQAIEEHIDAFSPRIVYTHFAGDLNIDHSIVHRAVMTACRPQPGYGVKEIYSFEVPSATGWLSGASDSRFEPNVVVDITEFLETKLNALREYDDELREFPHSRSSENLRHLAHYRGATVGFRAGEGFIAQRILVDS